MSRRLTPARRSLVSDSFFAGYVNCALWSSTDDDGRSMDEGGYRLTRAARRAMLADCVDFVEWCAEHGIPLTEQPDARNGYDFWLTRNRHGAGFWDRGLAAGDALTKAAHVFGSCDLYVTRGRWVHVA